MELGCTFSVVICFRHIPHIDTPKKGPQQAQVLSNMSLDIFICYYFIPCNLGSKVDKMKNTPNDRHLTPAGLIRSGHADARLLECCIVKFMTGRPWHLKILFSAVGLRALVTHVTDILE